MAPAKRPVAVGAIRGYSWPMTPAADVAGRSENDGLIQELASRLGSLGIEVADVAGHLEDLAMRASGQAAQFEELNQATETMVSGNRAIDLSARDAPRAASAAGT